MKMEAGQVMGEIPYRTDICPSEGLLLLGTFGLTFMPLFFAEEN
jgi:hypothetical protein